MTPSPLELFAFHLAIAMSLFLIVNVLGRNSPMFGYESLTMFQDSDDSAHFNFMFRVVTPVVLLIMVAALCYYIGADLFTVNIHRSIWYYISFRLIFNVARGRALLLPWKRLILQWAVTLLLAWLAYKHLITKREYLFPDLNTVGNEVWLAIAAYLYVLSNSAFRGDSNQLKRSERYTRNRFRLIDRKFGSVVKEVAGSPSWEALIFAVLIVEDFNRPFIFREVERLAFRLRLARTLGIMQVEATAVISDAESIRLGSSRLKTLYAEEKIKDHWRVQAEDRHYWGSDESVAKQEETSLLHAVLVRYNPSGDYAREIEAVYENLRKEFYPLGLPRLISESNRSAA